MGETQICIILIGDMPTASPDLYGTLFFLTVTSDSDFFRSLNTMRASKSAQKMFWDMYRLSKVRNVVKIDKNYILGGVTFGFSDPKKGHVRFAKVP